MNRSSVLRRVTDRPTWSEKNGRADILAHGFSPLDCLIVLASGLIVLGAAILVVAGLSQ